MRTEFSGKWVVWGVLIGSLAMGGLIGLSMKQHNRYSHSVQDQMTKELQNEAFKEKDLSSFQVDGNSYNLTSGWRLELQGEAVRFILSAEAQVQPLPSVKPLENWLASWFRTRFPKEKKPIRVTVEFEKIP